MSSRTAQTKIAFALLGIALLVMPATAQVVDENFNGVTGTGGGTFFGGRGFDLTNSWDDGLTGENAFAGTTGNANFGSAAAYGTTNGGVDGTGAGVIDILGVTFDLVRETFAMVTGTGGGPFLVGDGTPDTFNYVTNWDDGITGEGAFGGTSNGAVLQVGGAMSAEGLLTGGVGNTGGARIVVNNVAVGSGSWYAGLQWDLGAFPDGAPFFNPGFEDGFDHWSSWSNAYISTEIAGHNGSVNSLKLYGPFSGFYNTSGAYQDVQTVPGDVWDLSGFAQHITGDSIVGTANFVEFVIEFYDASNALISDQHLAVFDGTQPTDQWVAVGPVQAVAPAGAVSARAIAMFHQPCPGEPATCEGGAVYVDDLSFTRSGAGVDLSAYALTANVRGVANSGAGEVLGSYQLRLEDSDGDRLIFSGVANGSWQSIGGALSTAVEADANGTPATGVFNPDSPWFRAVIAFDNDATAWGTGGTLYVDDLLLGNSDPAGSAWYAGLFWNNLTMVNPDPAQLYLSADVLGNVVGGDYELRLEAMKNVLAGIDESFTDALGDCGATARCNFLSYDDYVGGAVFGYSDDWDTGIEGEGAFGGIFGLSEILPGGGFTAQALTTGGTDGTGGGEIRVEDIIFGPGGGWYAGLNWGPQALASTDLSQVVLEADIKGTIASGGELGTYELRIEDGEGDRLYFQATANGTWQHIGGALSTATEGPSLNGGGDGVFDLDSPSYNVAISFIDPQDTWYNGGVLEVDNIYLTPAATTREIGRITYRGTADGNWQTIGGLLSEGESSFKELNENFNSVTGVGGYSVTGGVATFGAQPFDTGIQGEELFAGTWGSAYLGSASAWGCTDCGVGGSGAANVSCDGGSPGASGGWWAGLSWVVNPPNWTDPNQVFCYADIKASKLAPYQLRVEDGSAPAANPNWLAFDHTPTTTGFEHVGGSMAQAVHGCPNPPCAPFNYNAGSYRATLVYIGDTWNTLWGPGGTLTIDNLFFTGLGLGEADTYTITLTFDNEVETWGTAGQLKIDNLYLGPPSTACPGDTNCDGQIDFADINPFVDALLNATYCDGTGENADVSQNGSVGFDDINPFVELLTTNPLPIACD